ncbi:MAG TPA: hypothetical protein VM487_04145 [Phycisphaerae bacterium]|nr:hypothetical protein [Phycisphaerae bacterium]
MPQPTAAPATQRPDIASCFMEYPLLAATKGLIASEVFPVINTMQQAGNFGIIPVEELLKTGTGLRGSDGGYERGSFKFTPSTFSTVEYGFEEVLDRRTVKMYQHYFDAEVVGALRARAKLLKAWEIRVATAVFNTTTWTGSALTTAITHEWDDKVNCTPRANVKAAKLLVLANSGLWPNALIINAKVFENLLDSAEIIDRLKYSGHTDPKPGNITPQALADALNIERVIIAGGVKDTANVNQDATIAQVWSDEYAMICKIADGPDFQEPGIGRCFHWGGDGSVEGGMVESYYEENKRADIIRVRHDIDEVTLYANAGHLLSNITT